MTKYDITYEQFVQKWDEYSNYILKIKECTDEESIQALNNQIKLDKKYPKYKKEHLKEIYKDA